MKYKNNFWSPWIWGVCVIILISTGFIVPLYGGFVKLSGVAVSEGINLGSNESVRYITQRLLSTNINGWVISSLIASFIAGVAVIEFYGLSPAFPWQAERIRRVARNGAWACVVLGVLTPFVQVAYSDGWDLVRLTFTELMRTDQMPVLSMLLFLPVVVALSTLIAYFTGLSFRTHIGVRWILPIWLKGTALIIFANVKHIDPALGSAGSVLAAILKRLKEEA